MHSLQQQRHRLRDGGNLGWQLLVCVIVRSQPWLERSLISFGGKIPDSHWHWGLQSGMATHIGAGDGKPLKTENQDACVVEPALCEMPRVGMFAVFDGGSATAL